MSKWWLLIIGSVSGGLGRYVLAGAVHRFTDARFPFGTLAVNLFGCFLIGILNGLAENKFLLSPQSRILLMTGFCGAFTTFSTFILETAQLFKDGEWSWGVLNAGASLILGFIIFWFGEILTRII